VISSFLEKKFIPNSKVKVLMEKKIGTVSILINNKAIVEDVNTLLSGFGDIILSRQGIPLRDEGIFVISLVVKSQADTINALTGKLGRLKGVKVRSILIKTE
jgi:putative iron-only hydrogenase system regulator